MPDSSVQEIYGNRVRVRVCGLCWKGDALLMVNHHGLYKRDFWAPPGGGIEFGERAEKSLQREFFEETGLRIKVNKLLVVCEFVKPPFHAIELFFAVTPTGGRLTTGQDPEMKGRRQIIRDVRYVDGNELKDMPAGNLHGLIKKAKTIEKITALNGYLKI
jgi:8-oxo-dGTP diphosphatase